MNLTAICCGWKEWKISVILLYGGYLKNHIEITYNYTHIFLSFSIEKYVGNKKKHSLEYQVHWILSLSYKHWEVCKNFKNLIKKQINFTKHDITHAEVLYDVRCS